MALKPPGQKPSARKPGDSPRAAAVRDMIAKRNYSKAIELLRGELQKRRGDERLRVQLADTLALAGRTQEAAEMLNVLADDLALTGQAGKAIAALKKVQKLEPGRPDIEEKLSYLITHQQRPAFDPWAKAKRAAAEPPRVIEPPPPRPVFGMEEISDEPGIEINPAPAGAPQAPSQGAPNAQASAASTPAPTAEEPADEGLAALFADAQAQDELVSMLEDVFTPVAGPSESPLGGEAKVAESPLFQDFSEPELVAVIRGLRLHTFEPGEILVSAGEPGDSMFLITTGSVRAYMKDKRGKHVQVREMLEGDFFGEMSVLTGNPRSATITAASYCELLELDRATLKEISAAHPRVREVLQEFYKRRASHSVEAALEQAQRP